MRFNFISKVKLTQLGTYLTNSTTPFRNKVAISIAGFGGGSLLILPTFESNSTQIQPSTWTHLLRLSYPGEVFPWIRSWFRNESISKRNDSIQLSLMEFMERFRHSSNDELVHDMKSLPSWTLQDLQEALQIIENQADSEQGVLAFKALTAILKVSFIEAHRLVSCGMDRVLWKLITSSNASMSYSQPLLNFVETAMERCPKLDVLNIDQWVVALMDKLKSKDVQEVVFNMTLLDSIVKTSNPKVVHVLQESKIWTHLDVLSCLDDTQVNAKIASLLGSLSQAGLRPSDEDWEQWFERLLKWSSKHELAFACSHSISTILQTDDENSSFFGRKWLSTLLVQLSEHPSLIQNGEGLGHSISPSEMRYLASEILGLRSHEPPMDYHESHYHPNQETLRLDWEDEEQSSSIAIGIRILCDLVISPLHQTVNDWLIDREILTLCQVLMKREDALIESLPSLQEQQQVTRLIATIAKKFDMCSSSLTSWIPWLETNLNSEDLLLASNTLRALLHIKQIQHPTKHQMKTLHDGVHFFQSSSTLLESLLFDKSDQTKLDIVFVHGIRGGPFITWRIDNEHDHHNTRSSCWPSHWLTQDHPEARLITVEFPAPVSTWEGGCNPLKETARTLMKHLKEAGIGSRPLMFISHSMGGIIVKEMLQQAINTPLFEDLISNLCGLAFISTPHHGTWLAELAWSLRHIGACPAPSLNLMKPGPYLEELNDVIKGVVLKHKIPVINFSEGKSSRLSTILPCMFVVPASSACPGFGRIIHLPFVDHIKTCKPKEKLDVFYSQIDQFLSRIVRHL